MKGIKIDFDAESGAAFKFDKAVEGFSATVQNGLVNLGQHKGSSHAYPDKGTGLHRAGLSGLLVSFVEAAHHSNFAAIDTVFFSRQTDPNVEDDDALANLVLDPVDFTGQYLRVKAQFESNAGETRGIVNEI